MSVQDSILAVHKTQICLGKCLLVLQMLQEIGALLHILNSGSSKEFWVVSLCSLVEVYLPFFPLALQLRVSFGLLNNQPPFFSVHLSSRSFADVDFLSIHPSEADFLVSEHFSFYGVRLLASCPTPNLEDQGIPLLLAPTP
jgi:hypothetical protein